MIGASLSHYRITAKLGAGGMGEVYRARDENLGRDVAIKVLPGEVAQDGERLARFKREAHLLAALNHTNIASIHGLEEANGKPFLVLELVGGARTRHHADRPGAELVRGGEGEGGLAMSRSPGTRLGRYEITPWSGRRAPLPGFGFKGWRQASPPKRA